MSNLPTTIPLEAGIRPWDTWIQVADEPPMGVNTTTWYDRSYELKRIVDGHGVQGGAWFSTWHPLTVRSTTSATPAMMNEAFAVPYNGSLIRVYIRANPTAAWRLLFKGTVKAVFQKAELDGIRYNFEAVSEVARLENVHVTAVFNLMNNAIHPVPRFDAAGNYTVISRKYTVAEIVDSIFDFRDGWSNPEYFTKTSIDWGNLRDDVRCGAFVPGQITFNNDSKGRALQEVLSRAGNFTFHYNPNTDLLRIVEFNLGCNNCGDQWYIDWPFPTPNGNYEVRYATWFNLKSDQTEWSSRETCNTVRITGDRIRFYSGHNIIPQRTQTLQRDAITGELVVDGNHKPQPVTGSEDLNTIDEGWDLKAHQVKRANNFEGCNYRFEDETNIEADKRKVKKVYVGMPLFPDWNIYEDFLPATFEILDVQMPPNWFTASGASTSNTPTVSGVPLANENAGRSRYVGKVEWMTISAGDMNLWGRTDHNKTDHLRAFQAWYATEKCPACDGSGAVQAVYGVATTVGSVTTVTAGGDNEPHVTFSLVNGRYVSKVDNYLMNPSLFGQKKPDGTEYDPVNDFHLHPFSSTTDYPQPHKNLCPFCRGVGLKPERKIRNIERTLAEGRNNQTVSTTPTQATEINIDPDATQTGPENWDQAQNRLAIHIEPTIQAETTITRRKLPPYAYRDHNFATIPKVAPAGGGALEDQVYKFPHPLKFVNINKRLNNIIDGITTESLKLVPSTWYATATYTTVKMGAAEEYEIDPVMGRVIFRRPVFIPCRKETSQFVMATKTRVVVDQNGLLAQKTPGRGRITVDMDGNPSGFWRPPRIWMSYFYSRDNFYDHMSVDANGNPRPDWTIQCPSPEDASVMVDFICRPMILDGRYVVDVQKKKTAEDTYLTDFSTGNRVLQHCMEDRDACMEISEEDFYAWPVPPKTDMTDAEMLAWKETLLDHLDPDTSEITQKTRYRYPKGKLLMWVGTTPGEVQLEMEGYTDADYLRSIIRPRVFSWTLRDDRSRMLGQACRALFAQNGLQVTGSLTFVGRFILTDTGMGWVDYPGRGRAAVKRVTHNFEREWTTDVEIVREHARAGEVVISEESKINQVEKRVNRLERLSEALQVTGKSSNNRPGGNASVYWSGIYGNGG